MSETAIRVSNLSKQYTIGSRQNHYATLRDSLAHGAAGVWEALRRGGRRRTAADSTIWALRNVDLEIRRGDVIGILGRNGAGKSTLLKVLSRITEPTSGTAELWGRVGSLLEVGTGFHPELTGRENVYLNGSILGMRKAEIDRKFDAIVAFSEIEKFIDTPAKHYSSGMFTRLAFAVSAHLEPEILMVDEVLAVGDVAFQKKCLGKMNDVAAEGRTVLFVSHNMAFARSLCRRGITLEEGRVVYDGDISGCIEAYLRNLGIVSEENGDTTGEPRRMRFGLIRLNGALRNHVDQDESVTVSVELALSRAIAGCTLYCILEDMHGRMVFHLREDSSSLGLREMREGRHELELTLPPLWLNPGMYVMHFKAILWGDSAMSRILSDRFPVDVYGEPSASECVLHPRVPWKVRSAAAVEV